MNNNLPRTFEQETLKWLYHSQISVYLKSRPKPLTGVTVCSLTSATLVARWNGSTHLIPTRNISYIRFMPGADPCDHPQHPLHETVQLTRSRLGKAAPPAIPAGIKDPDAYPIGSFLENLRPPGGNGD